MRYNIQRESSWTELVKLGHSHLDLQIFQLLVDDLLNLHRLPQNLCYTSGVNQLLGSLTPY